MEVNRREEESRWNELVHDDFCYIYFESIRTIKGVSEMIEDRYVPLSEMHMAYLHGEFEKPKRYYQELPCNDDRKFTAAAIAVICAISTGDYNLFEEIRQFTDQAMKVAENAYEEKISSLPQVIAYTSMRAVNMIPDWIKKGDFVEFPEELRPMLWHMHVMYLMAEERMYEACGGALAAINFIRKEDTFHYLDVYFLLFCAIGAIQREDEYQARCYIKEALDEGIPCGIRTPYAELLIWLGGLLEDCMLDQYEKERKEILAIWKLTSNNWVDFHNQFSQEHITKILTAQEYHVAFLITQGASYAECAKKMHLSLGRIKNIISIVYSKLYIKNRKELKQFVH